MLFFAMLAICTLKKVKTKESPYHATLTEVALLPLAFYLSLEYDVSTHHRTIYFIFIGVIALFGIIRQSITLSKTSEYQEKSNKTKSFNRPIFIAEKILLILFGLTLILWSLTNLLPV